MRPKLGPAWRVGGLPTFNTLLVDQRCERGRALNELFFIVTEMVDKPVDACGGSCTVASSQSQRTSFMQPPEYSCRRFPHGFLLRLALPSSRDWQQCSARSALRRSTRISRHLFAPSLSSPWSRRSRASAGSGAASRRSIIVGWYFGKDRPGA